MISLREIEPAEALRQRRIAACNDQTTIDIAAAECLGLLRFLVGQRVHGADDPFAYGVLDKCKVALATLDATRQAAWRNRAARNA